MTRLSVRHFARKALCLNEVAHLEGAEDEQHDAAGEILHRSAEGHADGHAAGGQEGGQGRGVHAQRSHHGNDEENPQGNGDEAFGERSHGGLRLLSGEAFLEGFLDKADDPAAHDVQGDGRQDLEPEVEGLLAEHGQEILGRRGADELFKLLFLGFQGVGGDFRNGDALEKMEHGLQVYDKVAHIAGEKEKEQDSVHFVQHVLFSNIA